MSKTVHTIEIDMDRPCSRCGHKGAGSMGLCITCAAKQIEAGLMEINRKLDQTAKGKDADGHTS